MVKKPYFERSTILITKSGFELSEYEERFASPLTVIWLEERRQMLYSLRKGVLLAEKMMVKQKKTQLFKSTSAAQRACLCEEMAARTYLDELFIQGLGPLVIWLTPRWWQDKMGFDPDKFKGMSVEDAYDARKKQSIDVFKKSDLMKRYPGFWEELELRFGDNVGDVAESYFALKTGRENIHELLKKKLVADLFDTEFRVTKDRDFVVNKIKKQRFQTIDQYREYLKSFRTPRAIDVAPVDYHWRRLQQRSLKKPEIPIHDDSNWNKRKRPNYKSSSSKKAKK